MAQILIDKRFSVLHLEGNSNYSKVLFALDTYQNPPRNCVIKFYKPISQKTQIREWITKQFQLEASNLKQISLSEPHLPEIYTYSYNAQGYYLAKELIEGMTLREHVQSQGVFSPSKVRTILAELLQMLEHLHRKNIIHQNIRPKNIILSASDNTPISINFGSIKQIVATFDFHGNKKIFSINDALGYTASEQALGKSIPASDIYSLGLTAIYLLTGKDPIHLSVQIDSEHYEIPSAIVEKDSNLAAIIARATSLNPDNRYQSAEAMLDALYSEDEPLIYSSDRVFHNEDRVKKRYPPKAVSVVETTVVKNKQKSENHKLVNKWWLVLISLIGLISLANLYFNVRNRKTSSDNTVLQIPETPILLPEISNKLPQKPEPVARKTSILNDRLRDVLEIPIFTTGSPQKQLRDILGEPNAIKKGYWKNSSAWIYKNQSNGLIDLGYLFDLNTNKLRQTEIAIASSVDLATVEEIANSLLQGNLNPSISSGIKQVYERKTKAYSFKLNSLEGSIEREADDNLYIGIWEADFH